MDNIRRSRCYIKHVEREQLEKQKRVPNFCRINNLKCSINRLITKLSLGFQYYYFF